MIAAFMGHRECLEALVEAGCDVSLVDGEGLDAAGHARKKGFHGCADFLGCHIDKRALERAALSGAASELHAKSI